ncbi:MAG: sigma 54-interacting transcriptional regulator [Firmicutes bacterium]|nr:sigma 54-interacting transcriptional regulator [Bacillota bacterium]
MNDWKTIFDSIDQGILICDKECRMEYFNASYGDFIGKKLEDVKGVLLTDLRPGAVAPKVLATGKPVQSLYRVEGSEDYFVDIYPIKENGETVGTVSVVTYVDRAQFLKEKINDLEEEEERLKVRMNLTNGTQYTFEDIVGSSLVLQNTIELAKKIASYDANVLLQGESGCGKELFAQAIHNESGRRTAPFVAINCAAISKTMLESELFGYEEGAFTGAKKGGKLGLFEAAEGGTIFLDEISEMDYDLQAKLLRALQEKRFRRIGGIKEIKMDVRVISACNVDIQQYIADKKFRSDLYYRISVAPINVPPLRERREDIPELARSFITSVEIQNKRRYQVTKEAQEMMMSYTWPGNIRELRNIIEYAAMMAVNGVIDASCIPPSILKSIGEEWSEGDGHLAGGGMVAAGGAGDARVDTRSNYIGDTMGLGDGATLSDLVKDFEQREIKRAIEKYGDTTEGKREAAKALGISLSSLYAKLSK